jgi:hypothetical protein
MTRGPCSTPHVHSRRSLEPSVPTAAACWPTPMSRGPRTSVGVSRELAKQARQARFRIANVITLVTPETPENASTASRRSSDDVAATCRTLAVPKRPQTSCLAFRNERLRSLSLSTPFPSTSRTLSIICDLRMTADGERAFYSACNDPDRGRSYFFCPAMMNFPTGSPRKRT